MSSRDPSADTPNATGVDVPLADPERTRAPSVAPYPGPAGGWGALNSVGRHVAHSRAPLRSVRSLLATNQPHGFDCPGCAWGDANAESSFAFCENGAKAVAWEITAKRVTRDFFARHSVSELLTWDDYRLEDQGRLTEAMRFMPPRIVMYLSDFNARLHRPRGFWLTLQSLRRTQPFTATMTVTPRREGPAPGAVRQP